MGGKHELPPDPPTPLFAAGYDTSNMYNYTIMTSKQVTIWRVACQRVIYGFACQRVIYGVAGRGVIHGVVGRGVIYGVAGRGVVSYAPESPPCLETCYCDHCTASAVMCTASAVMRICTAYS